MSLTKLYLALKTSLEGLASPNPTPAQPLAFGTNRVQLFNHQTEKKSLETNAVTAGTLPAAFIQIKEADFMHLKNNVQRRTLRFCIHISSLVYDADGNVMNNGAAATEFYDLVEAVHCEINGTFVEETTGGSILFTPFVRTEEKQFVDEDSGEDNEDGEFDRVQTHIITYETVQTVVNARKPQNQVNINRVLISDVGIDPNELEINGDAMSLDTNDPEKYREIDTGNTDPNIIVNP